MHRWDARAVLLQIRRVPCGWDVASCDMRLRGMTVVTLLQLYKHIPNPSAATHAVAHTLPPLFSVCARLSIIASSMTFLYVPPVCPSIHPLPIFWPRGVLFPITAIHPKGISATNPASQTLTPSQSKKKKIHKSCLLAFACILLKASLCALCNCPLRIAASIVLCRCARSACFRCTSHSACRRSLSILACPLSSI